MSTVSTEREREAQPSGSETELPRWTWRDQFAKRMRPVGIGVLFLIVGFFLVYPALMLVYGSVRSAAPGRGGQFTTEGLTNTLLSGRTYEVFANSVFLATTVTITSMALAVFFSWVVARTNTPGRKLIIPIMGAVLALPPLFFALSWALLGNPRAGLLNQMLMAVLPLSEAPININSWTGIILVLTLKATAFNFLLFFGAFLAMDRSLEEAALMNGASRMRAFFGVTLPVLAPALVGVTILAFVRGLQFFDVPLLLGRPADIWVFSTEIYRYIQEFIPGRYGEASSLALILIGTMILLVWFQGRLLRGRDFTTVGGKSTPRKVWDIGRWKYVCSGAIALYALFALGLPLFQLVHGSFQSVYGVWGVGELSLDNYREVLDRAMVRRSLRNTAIVATFGGFFAMMMAGALAYVTTRTKMRGRKLLDLMTWIPWAMPGVVLALGVLWAYLSVPPLRQFYGSRFLLVAGVMVGAIPICVRVVTGAFRQVGVELEESARIHGASWSRVFFGILLRLILPSFLAGWLVAGVIIIGDLSIPILLATPGNEMLSVAIFGIFQSGQAAQAAALFCIMLLAMAIVGGAAYGINRIGVWLTRGRRARRYGTGGPGLDAGGSPNDDPDAMSVGPPPVPATRTTE